MANRKVSEEAVEAVTFTKEQLMSSKKYFDRKDLISVLLKDGKKYSFDQVDNLIEKFMKGEVK